MYIYIYIYIPLFVVANFYVCLYISIKMYPQCLSQSRIFLLSLKTWNERILVIECKSYGTLPTPGRWASWSITSLSEFVYDYMLLFSLLHYVPIMYTKYIYAVISQSRSTSLLLLTIWLCICTLLQYLIFWIILVC